MPFANLAGAKLFYQQSGSGPDVVLLHAVTGNLAVWVFGGLFGQLAKTHRVLAYDFRGHGYSDAPAVGYTSSELADELAQLLDMLEIRSAVLVGHSFGAVVATHFGILYPDRCKGLVLSDPYFPCLADIEPDFARSSLWNGLRASFQDAGFTIGETVDLPALFQLVKNLREDDMNRLIEQFGPKSAGWLKQLPKLASTSCGQDVLSPAGMTRESLMALVPPTLALYDEHSPFKRTAEFLKQHVSAMRVEILPGANHMAPVENADVFNPRVVRFLGELESYVEVP